MLENERGATGDGTPTRWQDGNDNSLFNESPPIIQQQHIRAGASAPVAGLSPDEAVQAYRQVRRHVD
jgi:hypothetical protein